MAQEPREFAVEVTAKVDKANHSITLSWSQDTKNTGAINIYRKKKSDVDWGNLYKKVNAGVTTFTDTAVKIGEGYEYYLKKFVGSYTGGGYIYAGIELPLIENRGRILLVIESSMHTAIPNSINQYIKDLQNDGWKVSQAIVSASDKVDSVKQKIKDIYALYPTELKTITLIGHVPVPYSGLMNPDGHPDHKGAWPADAFYGDVVDDIDNWTDIVVKDTISATRRANKNWSNDGKFDNTYLPSEVELQVGRIDFYDMPAFTESESQLLALYFQKDHDFKIKKIKPQMKGIIDDNFKGYPEGFSGSAWRSFSTLLDTVNYQEEDYFTSLDTASYIWSYGCGGGWFQGAGGIGSTDDFATKKTNGIFTMLFGSYFGDWDVTNSFLRAPLASPMSTILTNAWAGRPWWQFHHMALGDNIGYSAQLAQNNVNTYTNAYNFAAGMVHIALMGDPSLRMHIIDPADTVNISKTHGGAFVNLNWTKSEDKVDGYMIYRASSVDGSYQRITPQPVKDSFYIDARPFKGENYYIVKAFRLEQTPSGSYFNQSLGSESGKVTVDTVDYQGIEINEDLHMACYPNPSSGVFRFVTPEQNQAGLIKVYDMQGKLELVIDYPAHTSAKEIDLSSLTSGVYLLNFTCSNKNAMKKLIINK
ncbi:MAG: T9SS type A sorting domain-containing protein [Bacteroidetes bacterium]|nr:T9SS type A sorting domain-containing protein [Bacteroidota bacterium]